MATRAALGRQHSCSKVFRDSLGTDRFLTLLVRILHLRLYAGLIPARFKAAKRNPLFNPINEVGATALFLGRKLVGTSRVWQKCV
jgi:hypothetical protein